VRVASTRRVLQGARQLISILGRAQPAGIRELFTRGWVLSSGSPA